MLRSVLLLLALSAGINALDQRALDKARMEGQVRIALAS